MLFAPWDAPVDEVRVVPESVLARDGVLRGLVRNWSRRLWAYGVTVTAGGREFVWPLSVQPGEVAPFEITGWDGPADPARIEFRVDADMSWHADPTRAWGTRYGVAAWELRVGELTRRSLPEGVRGRYASVTGDIAADAVSVGSVEQEMPFDPPGSHPSLGDFYEHVMVEDLRGYGAVFDSEGRVIDVGPAPAVAIGDRSEEVASLPHPLAMRRSEPHLVSGVGVQFDVHTRLAADGDEFGEPADGYSTYVLLDGEFIEIGERKFPRHGIFYGGFIVWVGGAHPEQDTG